MLENNLSLAMQNADLSDLVSLADSLQRAIGVTEAELCSADLKTISWPVPGHFFLCVVVRKDVLNFLSAEVEDRVESQWNNSLTLAKLRSALVAAALPGPTCSRLVSR